jgi:hypothetical protein
MSFWPRMRPLIVTVPRDDAYLRDLDSEVARFRDELHELVSRLRGDSEHLRAQLQQSVLLAG